METRIKDKTHNAGLKNLFQMKKLIMQVIVHHDAKTRLQRDKYRIIKVSSQIQLKTLFNRKLSIAPLKIKILLKILIKL